MEKEPREAFEEIRKDLQLILAHAEMSRNGAQCQACACNVLDIVKELRVLEAYIHEVMSTMR